VTARRFGVSTHLFHEHRLDREHLVHIAAHGFETVEVFATRSHFDYRSEEAIAALQEELGRVIHEVPNVFGLAPVLHGRAEHQVRDLKIHDDKSARAADVRHGCAGQGFPVHRWIMR